MVLDTRFYLYNSTHAAVYCAMEDKDVLPCYYGIVTAPIAPILSQPNAKKSSYDHTILYGDIVAIYGEDNGYYWVRYIPPFNDDRVENGYVGYINKKYIKPLEASHNDDIFNYNYMLYNNYSYMYSAPNLKSPIIQPISLGSYMHIEHVEDGFGFNPLSNGYIYMKHVCAINHLSPYNIASFMRHISRFMGQPYLWGGAHYNGVDCSGLLYLVLRLMGQNIPRDSDCQAKFLGHNIIADNNMIEETLHHGDILYWPTHIAVYDKHNHAIIHANAYDMKVASHPFSQERLRVQQAVGCDITQIKRLL